VTTPAPVRIGIAGALGRMGQAVWAQAQGVIAVGGVADRPETRGSALGELTLTDTRDLIGDCDVIIDFSTPEASADLADQAFERGRCALVIGTTGLSGEQTARVARAARRVAVVMSGNFGLGVNVLAGLVEQAAARLTAQGWDIEIVEAHHRRKVDAPSGSALMLGEAAARGRGARLSDKAVRGRDGLTGERPVGAIGFSSIRGGGIVGEHSVILASEDEILTLSHSARDRGLFAKGAILAARWAAAKPAGLYDMMDVLGFRD
jgi:4-hydroxy-tetrahydrodipicolinate reductase